MSIRTVGFGPVLLALAGLILFALLGLRAHAAPLEMVPAATSVAKIVPGDAGVSNGIGTSPSAVAAAPDDAGGIVTNLYEAGKSRNYRALAAALCSLVVLLMRRWGAGLFKPLGTDRGGALLALVVGVAGAFATALAAGAPLGFGLVYDGLVMGVTAAGGFVVLKRLVAPRDAA